MVSQGIKFVSEPKKESYGMVAVFEDLYGNKWDLLELNNDHPISKRAVTRRSRPISSPPFVLHSGEKRLNFSLLLLQKN